jgi:hypothetical protein
MSLRDDLPRQRRALLFGLGMIVAGLSTVGLAHLFHTDGLEAEHLAQSERNDFQSRLARIAQEEKEIQAGDVLFRNLSERGILGEEKRMDWIENLAHIQAERRLYDIRWELSPQRPLEAEFGTGSSGEFAFMASALHVQLDLLHEEDLLRFLNDMKGRLSAYVRVRQCSLSRQPPQAGTPQLQAECQLDLITLKTRGAAPSKQP